MAWLFLIFLIWYWVFVIKWYVFIEFQWRTCGGRSHDRVQLEFRGSRWSLVVASVATMRDLGLALWAILQQLHSDFLDEYAAIKPLHQGILLQASLGSRVSRPIPSGCCGVYRFGPLDSSSGNCLECSNKAKIWRNHVMSGNNLLTEKYLVTGWIYW